MKKRFLVVHDYGMGGAWAYVLADSAKQIEAAFDVIVVERHPYWLRGDALKTLRTYDIDQPGGWLADVRRQRDG